MKRTISNTVTGLAIAAAVGTAAYAASSMTTSNQRRKMKKNADRAIKNVSNLIDNVSYMMR